MVVNLTGPAVDLDIDSLLSPEGLEVDPLTDPYFAEPGHSPALERPGRQHGRRRRPGPAARLTAGPDRAEHDHPVGRRHQRPHPGRGRPRAHRRGRAAQLPVPPRPAPRLRCGPGAPHHADPRRRAGGPRTRSSNRTGSSRATSSAPWATRTSRRPTTAGGCAPGRTPGCSPTRSRSVPCAGSASDWTGSPRRSGSWANPTVQPDVVVVAKRQVLGFTITNRVKDLPPTPPTQPSTPTPTPTSDAHARRSRSRSRPRRPPRSRRRPRRRSSSPPTARSCPARRRQLPTAAPTTAPSPTAGHGGAECRPAA